MTHTIPDARSSMPCDSCATLLSGTVGRYAFPHPLLERVYEKTPTSGIRLYRCTNCTTHITHNSLAQRWSSLSSTAFAILCGLAVFTLGYLSGTPGGQREAKGRAGAEGA